MPGRVRTAIVGGVVVTDEDTPIARANLMAAAMIASDPLSLFNQLSKENDMPGRGSRFTAKQDRQAQHVAASERKRGVSAKKAKAIGYATVNKQKKGK